MKVAQARVQRFVDGLVRDRVELGIQVAAYLDGRLVVDTWAGVADDETDRPVDGETLFTMFSATKGVAATAVHMLADRGQVDYEQPVAHYWPAFGARGKDRITLRQALSHRAGIPQMLSGMTLEQRCDWDAMTAAIADLEPEWPPGSRTVYHGLTFGWILGEVLRRVDGRTIRQFAHEEIGRPLGVADLNIGVEPGREGRIARLRDAAGQATSLPAATWNDSRMRRAIIPAAGGLFNARSLARLYAALAAGGELDGARLLSAERIDLARARQTPDADARAVNMVFGLGYRLGSSIYPPGSLLRALSTRESVFGHTGAGGCIGFADPERHFAIAVTKNLLRGPTPDRPFPTELVVQEVRQALGIDA